MLHYVHCQSMNLLNFLVRAHKVHCAFFQVIRLELTFMFISAHFYPLTLILRVRMYFSSIL